MQNIPEIIHPSRKRNGLFVKSRRLPLLFILPLICALFGGCKDKEEIKVYRVSKPEPDTSTPESPAMSGMPPMGAPMESNATAGQPSQFTGTPPSDWEAQPLSSMRQASYLVKGENGATADISLVVLAGSAGGILENINRWLSQLGQPAISAEQLALKAQHVTLPLGDVTVVDLEGLPQGAEPSKDGRIIAGIASSESRTIFFKMRGNAALAESQKDAFIKWIGTVRMTEAAAGPDTSAPAGPAASTISPAVSEKPQIKWETPEAWKSVAPSSMRYASFGVSGPNNESADVSVSVFGGEGGGDLDNVNRWRTQIGLEALRDGDLKSLVVPVHCKDGEILTVDMTGPKARILAGWARIDGKSWFFKLIAPAQLASDQKAGFVKFLQSVQFHP